MIVLHGWWSTHAGDPRGELIVWGEDSAGPLRSPTRRGRRPLVRPHPFALPANALATVVAYDGTPGSAVLALPTTAGGPAPSPEVLRVRGAPHGTAAPEPGRWEVSVLALSPAEALAFLLAGNDDAGRDVTDAADVHDVDGAGMVTVGGALRALQRLAGFAADLVDRGRVLPTVRPAGEGQALALWSPVVLGPDAEWLRAVAAGLPLVSIADDASGGDRDGVSARVVAAATDALVDATVRSRLAPGSPRRAAPTFRTALTSVDPHFPVSPAELTALDGALAEWQRDITYGGAVRACFRLAEPDEETGDDARSWAVHFALQSAEQPSLVVDAERVWQSGAALRALARHVENPQETLLGQLGRAVRLYPAIEASLRTPRPSLLELDATGAYAFLTDAAPVLVAAGFGVLLPGWWTKPALRMGAKLSVSTPTQPGAVGTKAGIGQHALVDFRWDLAIGDETLTEEEVADLVAAQQPLVRVRGQWMYVDADRLARARDFLTKRRQRAGRMPVGDVLAALGALGEGPAGLPVVDVAADGWLADLLSGRAERRLAPRSAPESFKGALRPYQERGLAWLSFLESVGLGGILADDMGLGKTVQLLALLCDGVAREGGPSLLVCPMSLVGNWQREAERFAPSLRVHVHHGAERPRGKAFHDVVARSDLVITTYGLVTRDIEALNRMEWRRVILDEAQAVKNAATRSAVAVRSLSCVHRFSVTGTPVENRLADLWSLMDFANPGLLGSPASFKSRFATPIERHGDTEAAARLKSLTQPFVLRRVKTDTSVIADLPAKIEMDVVCSLTREQASLYQAVVADMMDRIDNSEGIERRGLVLATMTKLKQVCNHPAHFLRDGSSLAGRSGKLARVEEILVEVLATGEKALLFTQYAEFGDMVTRYLTARFGREVGYLHGGQTKAQRDELVARFQDPGRGGPSLFVLSLKAGGTGLTLTAANHVIHLDRWWNPAVEDQATDRAFRIGQQRAVQVRKLICAGTLEEKIATMILDKRELAARVVGSGESWLTELSTSALRDLFTLDAGSVVE